MNKKIIIGMCILIFLASFVIAEDVDMTKAFQKGIDAAKTRYEYDLMQTTYDNIKNKISTDDQKVIEDMLEKRENFDPTTWEKHGSKVGWGSGLVILILAISFGKNKLKKNAKKIETNTDELEFGEIEVNNISHAKGFFILNNSFDEDISVAIASGDITNFKLDTGKEWENERSAGVIDYGSINETTPIKILFKPTENKEYSATIIIRSEGLEEKEIELKGEGI